MAQLFQSAVIHEASGPLSKRVKQWKNPVKEMTPFEIFKQNVGKSVPYKPRNLPCSIVKNPWYVAGRFNNGKSDSSGGVLEWCYDREDAEYIMSQMKRDLQYSQLSIEQWEE